MQRKRILIKISLDKTKSIIRYYNEQITIENYVNLPEKIKSQAN